tara:strand:- start:239 stop:523 length:285 start_codon:yes stop_codon:yes gene_type:complete
MDVTRTNRIICKFILTSPIKKKNNKKKIEKNKLPTAPHTVLFGLTEVNFLPLKNLPNTKPPMSVKIHIRIVNIKKAFVDVFKNNIKRAEENRLI